MTEQDAADAVEGEEADTEHAGNGADGDVDEVRADDAATVDVDGVEDGAETADGQVGDDATDVDGDATDVDEALVERVAESDPESVATELAALRTRVEGLEGQLDARDEEIDDLSTKLKRKQADFQNFKKRMEKRRDQERERATEDLVERLLDVRDNLVRALDQDADADDGAIRDGVETTLSQFDRVLDDENVDIVEPEPGEEVDPHTHEVLMRVDSDQPEGTIDEVHRPGYVMAEKVLQTAQVTVSDGE